MKTGYCIAFFLLINTISFAQNSQNTTDFEYLVSRVKADYPGYNEKVTENNKKQLRDLESKTRTRLLKNPDSSSFYFAEYLHFFNDKHLYIESIALGKTPVSKTTVQLQQINIDSLQSVSINTTQLAGIWKSFDDEIAIVQQRNKRTFTVISIKSNKWQQYRVLYEIKSLNKFDYQVSKNYIGNDSKVSPIKLSLLQSGKVIEFHSGSTYVRKSDSDILEQAFLYSYIPVFPSGINSYWVSLSLSDSTYFLRVPSFRSDESNRIVQKNWEEIRSRPNLIIDLRDNTGGQDENYKLLSELAYTKSYTIKGVEWYATKGNIDFFENAIKDNEIRNGEQGLQWTNMLLAEMKKNIGGFVTHPSSSAETVVKIDTVLPYPRNIGILINQTNASSAEQFLLEVKNSEKVIFFGNQNTAGVLDYSNVVKHKMPSGNYVLAMPMTRSKRLPNNPIDNIGIKPDVIVPSLPATQLYDRLDNWDYFVKAYLELLSR